MVLPLKLRGLHAGEAETICEVVVDHTEFLRQRAERGEVGFCAAVAKAPIAIKVAAIVSSSPS